MKYESEQAVKQLEKQKGGYFYLRIDADVVNQFEYKKATRLICTLDKKIELRCGLNHLGDGHFFVIIATRYMEKLGKKIDDIVHFKLEADPDQLGVKMPEVLEVLLSQEVLYKNQFDALTDGKKRSLIYSIAKVKDIDKQVNTIIDFLANPVIKIKK